MQVKTARSQRLDNFRNTTLELVTEKALRLRPEKSRLTPLMLRISRDERTVEAESLKILANVFSTINVGHQAVFSTNIVYFH